MEKQLSRSLVAVCILFGTHALANDRGTDMDLLKKSIELTEGNQQHGRMDAESAQKILAHFTSSKDRWDRFLWKIREGDKGAIVTALYVTEFSSGQTRTELHFALQETMIDIPEVLLEANKKTNTTQDWICGKPVYENYDLATHLNNDRLAALESLLAAMDSKDEDIRNLYDRKLRGAAETCLDTLRRTIRQK